MPRKKIPAPILNTPESRLLDIPRAAGYLSTTNYCVRMLACSKSVPSIRLGRKILFDRQDLDRYVDALKAS